MHQPAPDSEGSTRIYCDETGRAGSDHRIRTYGWCPFCGSRVAGDAAHELVISAPG